MDFSEYVCSDGKTCTKNLFDGHPCDRDEFGKRICERLSDSREVAIHTAMKLFEKAAPPDAYTKNGVVIILEGFGIIDSETM